MTKQLNEKQLKAMAKYERFFSQAVGARYCSYPGQAGVEEMLKTWNEVTGEGRKIRNGCSTCIFHLVVDLGTLYLAQKKDAEKKALEEEAKEAAAKAEAEAAKAAGEESGDSEKPNTQPAEEPAAENEPQEGAKEAEGSTAQPEGEKPSTAKREGKKTK